MSTADTDLIDVLDRMGYPANTDSRANAAELLHAWADKRAEQQVKEIAKAYGGCTSCYGKGYATGNDCWHGIDTDTDIGSPGGYVSGGNPNAMKFCSCDRGKQLRGHIERRVREARLDELKDIRHRLAVKQLTTDDDTDMLHRALGYVRTRIGILLVDLAVLTNKEAQQ